MNSVLPELLTVQALPCIAVAHALQPRPGDKVLDMCCGHGGKAFHVAALMRDSGVLWRATSAHGS